MGYSAPSPDILMDGWPLLITSWNPPWWGRARRWSGSTRGWGRSDEAAEPGDGGRLGPASDAELAVGAPGNWQPHARRYWRVSWVVSVRRSSRRCLLDRTCRPHGGLSFGGLDVIRPCRAAGIGASWCSRTIAALL